MLNSYGLYAVHSPTVLRREYAEQWAALRRALSTVGDNYIARAYIRTQLRLIERCYWNTRAAV